MLTYDEVDELQKTNPHRQEGGKFGTPATTAARASTAADAATTAANTVGTPAAHKLAAKAHLAARGAHLMAAGNTEPGDPACAAGCGAAIGHSAMAAAHLRAASA